MLTFRVNKQSDLKNQKSEKVLELLLKSSKAAIEELYVEFGTSKAGIASLSVDDKILHYGYNIVETEKPKAWYIQLVYALLNPFNLLLLALALISWASDDYESMIIMVVMVAISVSIKFTQEYSSAQDAEKLKSLVQITAHVHRLDSRGNEESREIEVKNIVLGDIVTLSAGDMIPADVRIISAKDLFVSQSMITGEAIPVEKSDKYDPAMTNALDQQNVCFMGTSVVSGTARALVVGTGNNTYFGALAEVIECVGARRDTAFEIGISKVSWLLMRFIFAMAPIVLFVNGFAKGNWFDAMLFAVSVAVGLTPEMLPMIVTTNLAKGANRMAKSKVVVKKLNSIHNLGAMDILCTDKTGTLTQDKIIMHDHLDINGNDSTEVLKYAYLNSMHQTGLNNLLDKAIVNEADERYRVGGFFETIAKYTKVDELPFDFMRRRMSVILANSEGDHEIICKGAVEELFAVSTHVDKLGKVLPLTEELKAEIRVVITKYNEDGFRVLLVGYKVLKKRQNAYNKEDETGLIIKGLLTFLDPPKESAYQAIPILRNYGIQIKVITGDNAVVTRKVCKEVGIDAKTILLGSEIDQMSEEDLKKAVEETVVFAKVSPLQKLQIISLLRENGHTVGFLGDGVNDAAALKEADVGISFDVAADIAKASADMILLEKSLTVIAEGVIEGRKTFINIMKYIKMALSSNLGNVLSVLGASLMLPFLPLLPAQLLIQNLLYDVSQLAIPLDSVEKNLLRLPKNWDSKDLVRFMFFVGPISSIFDYMTFALMWFYYGANSEANSALFHTGWFVEGLITQTLIIHMIRTEKIPFIQSTAAPAMLAATFIISAIGIALPFSSFAAAMGMVALPLSFFGFLGIMMFGYWLVINLIKRWYVQKFNTWI